MFCPNPECPEAADSGSPGEYRADVLNCPRCDAALAPEPPQWHSGSGHDLSQDDDRGFVVVARLDSEPALAIARALLDEAGIRQFVLDQQSFSPWGGPGGTGILGRAELAVEPDRVEEAKLLLTQIPEAVPEIENMSADDDLGVFSQMQRFGERRETPSYRTWLRRQIHGTPSLAGVLFFGGTSVLLLTVALLDMVQLDQINFILLCVGAALGVVALNAEKRRRQANRGDRNG
jgi:hypothetical protein